MNSDFREGFEKVAIPFTSASRSAGSSIKNSLSEVMKTTVKSTKPLQYKDMTKNLIKTPNFKSLAGLFGPGYVR